MRAVLAASIVASLLVAPGISAWAACHPHGDAVVLTVAAAPQRASRGGNTKLDQLANHQDHSFTSARSYTLDALAALPSEEVAFTLPYDGQRHVFAGPALTAVLADAGDTTPDAGAAVFGIDGYHIDFVADDLAKLHLVLSLCRDGQPHGIGDLGPAFVVHAPAEGDKPSDEEFARMVWGVYFIAPLPPR